MKPTESVGAYEEAVESAGYSLPELTPSVGVEVMLSFYETVPAEGCLGLSADMLLYEWGVYDWGEGQSFELSITRQFIELGEGDQPNISQLRLVFGFPPSSDVALLGEGNRWCESRHDLPNFKSYVLGSAPFKAHAEQEPPSVRLSHSYV